MKTLVISSFLLLFVDFIGFAKALVFKSVVTCIEHPMSKNATWSADQKPLALTSQRELPPRLKLSFGSARVSQHTFFKRLLVTSRMLLRLMEKNPRFLHDNAWCKENFAPHSQDSGTLYNYQPQRTRIKSKYSCLVSAYPSLLSGNVVSQVNVPFICFRLFNRICCSFKLDLLFCSCFLFRSILAYWILFLIVSDLSSALYCRVWSIIFVQGHSVSFTQFSHLSIGMRSPPNLGLKRKWE